MNDEYKISDETLLKILYNSPMLLPANPSEKGFGATQIKSYFYKFIEEIIKAVNKEFLKVGSDMTKADESFSSLGKKNTELLENIQNLKDGKVNKEPSKGLSSNDFTNAYKKALDNLEGNLGKKLEGGDIVYSKSNDGLTYIIRIKGRDDIKIDIPKDQFLKSVAYDDKSHMLKFVFETAAGESEHNIDLGELVNVYNAGAGLSLENSTFFIDLDVLAALLADNHYGIYAADGKLGLNVGDGLHYNFLGLPSVDTDIIAEKEYVDDSISEAKRTVVRDIASTSVNIEPIAKTDYVYEELTDISIGFLDVPTDLSDTEIDIIFRSGEIPTTLQMTSQMAVFEEFVPSANSIIEINAKYYIDKWVVLFTEVPL